MQMPASFTAPVIVRVAFGLVGSSRFALMEEGRFVGASVVIRLFLGEPFSLFCVVRKAFSSLTTQLFRKMQNPTDTGRV